VGMAEGPVVRGEDRGQPLEKEGQSARRACMVVGEETIATGRLSLVTVRVH
jgi:hypothetical protein